MGEHRQKLVFAAIGRRKFFHSQLRSARRPTLPRDIRDNSVEESRARDGMAVSDDLVVQPRPALLRGARMDLADPTGLEIDMEIAVLGEVRAGRAMHAIELPHVIVVNEPLNAIPGGKQPMVRALSNVAIEHRPENSMPRRLLVYPASVFSHVYRFC
jgi:hypothetical protein